MAPNLSPGRFKIISLTDGHPTVGVNFTRPAFQRVHLRGPVTTWLIRKEGDDTYALSVGGYGYTGVVGGNVIASVHPEQRVEWRATYRKLQDAYTISPVHDDIRGWTAPRDESHGAILIRVIAATHTIPPRFDGTQLFRFEEVEDLDE